MLSDIIEGFLCPICMKDLGTVTQLQGHFEEEHSSEDKDVFNQLKGFFDKAKRTIFKAQKDSVPTAQSGETSTLPDQLGGISGYDPTWWEDQELGALRNHTDSFKAVRGARVDHFVVETNKLLIRLDKLLGSEAPVDPKKRKAFERGIVPWIPDKEVPACLSCYRGFGLLTRRHHCRLCGGIMCDRCSEFMSSSFAQKLINPGHTFSGDGFLKRSNSNTSLNSLLNMDGESHMRTCKTCRKLLERRDYMAELRNTIPAIVQIYNKMKECVAEAERILPDYLPMVESLSQGESVYDYRQALILRTKLVKLYEAVDQLSKKILIMNMSNDPPPNSRQVHLQKSIRMYAGNFMQDNLLGIQQLPSEEDYRKLQAVKVAKIQRRIAAERQVAMEVQEKERQERERLERERAMQEGGGQRSPEKSPKLTQRRMLPLVAAVSKKGHTRSDSNGSQGVGWKPSEEPIHVSKASNPILQQMEIIKGYIKQARQAKRNEEVTMLEQNLRDLQKEFMRQQNN